MNPITRFLFAITMAVVAAVPAVKADTESDVVVALTVLENHILGSITLSGSEIAANKATIDSGSSLFGSSTNVMSAAFDLVETYDVEVGALWVKGSPIQSFDRPTATDEDIDWVVYNVMQTLFDEAYTVSNIAANEALLNGRLFGSSADFPGSVAAPAVVTHTATINASYPDTVGWLRAGDSSPARKPTGTYVAPGTIVTITVPAAIVGKGYQIRVGAHSWDLETRKSTVLRLDRSSMLYDIDQTQIKVGSPIGGGIYIEVPYLQDEGVIDIDITGAVRSPYFSANRVTGHMTTLAEWQNTERNHPAPWTDFQTEKYMAQVPTDWIYNLDDPATLMADWDLSCDIMNDLMGFPHDRGKETLYLQVDVILRGAAYFPGYPTANRVYSPDTDYGGLANNHFTKGPQQAPSYLFHEQGHAYLMKKFDGETESIVNLLHVPIWNVGFGIGLDTAFAASRDFDNNPYRTLDNTAVTWMTCFNFVNRLEMGEKEKKYQLKGHAKFVDIARLFGWDAVNDFFHGMVLDDVSRDSPQTEDQLIDRLSSAANVDIRPLMHFWGVHPGSGATNSALHVESIEIYDLLMTYRNMIPENNAAFQNFTAGWWGKQPSLDGFQTENEHAQQWDSYDTNTNSAIKARLDEIIDLYFPDGEPVLDVTPPSPDPMTWVLQPAAYNSSTISMEATVASDRSNPVEYYFENSTNGDNSGWITGTSWSNTGLTSGQSNRYRVRARDREGNVGSWSSVADAVPAADNTAPTPNLMSWATPPAALSSSAIIMTATRAIDPIGVQYYFTCTSGAGHDSGWQDSPTYIDAGLDAFATCSYTVVARDKSANANQTSASASAAATTLAVPGVLFADTFNRADSTDLNASIAGKSGSFGMLNYGTRTFNTVDLDIKSNRLRINGPASDGSYGGLVYINDHNFADAAIAVGGGFSIRVDIAAYSTEGSGRQMSVGVGQSLDELATQPGADPSSHSSDLVVAYRNTTDDLEIYKNGLLDVEETILNGLPNAPTTMRIDYTFTDFYADSTVIYHVYFDDSSTAFTSGTFTWSGTLENYISLASNLSNDSLFDNLEIRGEDIYDDQTLPTPNPMTWESTPTPVSANEITMTASEAKDLSGVEYYFTCTAGGGNDSGWQDDPTYADTGLTPETTYSYTVMVRDKSVNHNGTAASVAASATTDVAPDVPLYLDTFDNDGLTVNSGEGGGMGTFSRQGGPFVDNGAMVPSASTHNDRGNVYSLNDFDLSNGFKLEVSYNNATVINTSASRVNIGLMDAAENFTGQSDAGYLTDYLSNNRGQYGIGMDLTANDSNQGLAFSDGSSVAELSAIPFETGTHSFVLEVDADSNWSYSLDGDAAVTGPVPGGLDLNRDYKFFTFVQDTENGFTMNSVSLELLEPVVPEIGDIDFGIVPGSSEIGFSWYGESGQSYRLEVTEDLTSGSWETITTVSGANEIISLTDEMDKTNAFYRIYLLE